ncbi:MAG: sugar phosphate isomerase/epimerase [Desulfobulbaceae bacterium]|nr:MAG: sugar phosphate isomerase/epimerase [Desulfobulbaceae bacterium]
MTPHYLFKKYRLCMTHYNPSPEYALSPAQVFERITLAVSTQYHSFPKRFDWIAENGFGMAYTPDGQQLELTRDHLKPYLSNGVPVRHHAYFPGFEIGNRDQRLADEALSLHLKAVDAIVGCGEPVMTVHVGLVAEIDLAPERVIKNLSKIVNYGSEKGVTICLENLRFGPTSHPETMLEWTNKSGASITMDVGHAVSCDRVRDGELTVPQIIELFSPKLSEVHFYEYETNTHHAPRDMSILGPIVDSLLKTDCRWWTIELNDYEDILNTKRLITEYLAESETKRAA